MVVKDQGKKQLEAIRDQGEKQKNAISSYSATSN